MERILPPPPRATRLTRAANRTIIRTVESTRGDGMAEMALMSVREKLTGLNRELQRSPGTVVKITHRGRPSMALMSSELYDTLVETLEVISDPAAADALRKSLRDIAKGRLRTLDDVAARL